MKAYIFLGGEVYLTPKSINIEKGGEGSQSPNPLVIAADSGYDNARSLGLDGEVQVLIGDLDSISSAELPSGLEIVRLPPEKDDSDASLAVNMAIERGADEIFLIGGLSGRLDHTLANLRLIEMLRQEHGIRATIFDGKNRVRLVCGESAEVRGGEYRYFSLIPVSHIATGITVEGAKYPLRDATLSASTPSLGISNETTDHIATVTCRDAEGGLFLIESN